MFTQMSDELFVVHGWNWRKNEATPNLYHLSRSRNGLGVSVMCLCVQFQETESCFHVKFIEEFGEKYFPFESGENDRTFMFSRYEEALADSYVSKFSVPTSGATFKTLKNRAIVEHNGLVSGEGFWKCSLDQHATNCSHINAARKSLQQHVQRNINAEDQNGHDESLRYPDDCAPTNVNRLSTNNPQAVSYKSLPPPVWARIKGDREAPSFPTLNTAPELIKLTEDSTCHCTSPRQRYSPSDEVQTIPCIIYTLVGVWTSIIEVQKCKACPSRYIGPDGRHLGLFNWNNRALFALDLLDDYTSAFTTSETPFVAWVTVVNRRYLTRGSPEFVTDKTFRAVWFSYIKLVEFNGDMTCQKCGPNPDVAIFDGVTLAFNRKNLLSTIRPPTTITSASQAKPSVRPAPNLQCLKDKGIRKRIRLILSGPKLLVPDFVNLGLDDSGAEDEASKRRQAEKRKAEALAERMEMVPGVVKVLTEIDQDLGALFDLHFGEHAIARRQVAPGVYRKLFLQIAAEESALQLVNGAALGKLLSFITSPNNITASELKLTPAIYHVICHEMTLLRGLSNTTLGVCKWLYKTAYISLRSMEKYGYPEKSSNCSEDSDTWQKTGACYGLPPIRDRPSYPSFPNDSGSDKANQEKRGEGCNKFYAKYGESRLTGGIMCVWCTHSVCYGFHCIPSAEGRNDVFSALYTRWETAPSIIVYDFACALQPYCMAREPEFFSKTLFVIDVFHCSGHTKCGHATFLATYCEADPRLLSINSSAAECGNSGIKRIRKSVSYMSQDRAVLFTKVFISIWNRIRIQQMEKRQN
ncbi:hypothetical protein BJ912DRAFT_1102840 [Pholiota molesta]|nr:hypothetical protein BJ912DRAFT_1102840 [Pholiota molesta]